jgi:hypothetical protein
VVLLVEFEDAETCDEGAQEGADEGGEACEKQAGKRSGGGLGVRDFREEL